MQTERVDEAVRQYCMMTGDPVSHHRAKRFEAWLETAAPEQLGWHLDRAQRNDWAYQVRTIRKAILKRLNP